jgi:hypothetical protein
MMNIKIHRKFTDPRIFIFDLVEVSCHRLFKEGFKNNVQRKELVKVAKKIIQDLLLSISRCALN